MNARKKPPTEPAEKFSAALDDPRVVEALEEYLTALETGQKPNRQAFLARHAAIAEGLAECLDGIETLHAASLPAPSAAPPQAPVSPRGEKSTSASGLPGGGAGEEAAGEVVPASGPLEWLAGTLLGEFRIMREIGRGGMGIVYEAEQVSLGRRIALKVLPFAWSLDPRQLQRFKNEARAAAQLHHQNIVPVYAVGCERGVHFFAMQFIGSCRT